jgi:hypothetical protein
VHLTTLLPFKSFHHRVISGFSCDVDAERNNSVMFNLMKKGKGKAIPLQALRVPGG